MATITVDTFLDDAARTSGETMAINGGVLTIRTDTRWHSGSPAGMTGSCGSYTISPTLGGGLVYDATNVRWMPFDTGTGTVPAIGTVVTQGGISGYLLGVWPDVASAPILPGEVMPTSGFLKFREIAGGTFSAGALTGIDASATSSDVVGWIEIVSRTATTINVPRLGFHRSRGSWFDLGVTSGSAGQTFQVPNNGGGAASQCPGVYIETSVGSDEYEWYEGAITSVWNPVTPNFGTDVRSKFIEDLGGGQLRLGQDVGYVPVAGLKVRIPNIILRQTSTVAVDNNINLIGHFTIGTRPDWTTTSAGVIDLEFLYGDWYLSVYSSYSIRIRNCAFLTAAAISNTAIELDIDNLRISGGNSQDSVALLLTANSFGGNISNSTFARYQAGSNDHVVSMTTTIGLTFTNCVFGVVQYTRGTGRSVYLSQCTEIDIINCTQYNSCIAFITSFDCSITNITHIDRLVGVTIATTGLNIANITASCSGIFVDGVSFGPVANVNPYNALFYAQNSRNLTFRNAGTRSFPLSCNTGFEPQYVFQDAGANSNVKVQRIYLEKTRTATAVYINTSDGITVENCGGFGSTVSDLPLSLNTTNRGNLASTVVTTSATTSVYGTFVEDAFISDTDGWVIFRMNEPTTSTAGFVSTNFGLGAGFTSTGIASLPNVGDSFSMEMPYYMLGHDSFGGRSRATVTGTLTQNMDYQYQLDTGSGFGTVKRLYSVRIRANLGTVGTATVDITTTPTSSAPQVGDYVGTLVGTHLPSGTTITDISVINATVSRLTLSNNILVSIGTNLQLFFWRDIQDEVISPTGAKLKLIITAADANATNAVSNVFIPTSTSLTSQANNLYSIENTVQVTLSGLKPNTEVRVYLDDDGDNGAYLAGIESSGTSFSFNVLENRVINIMINNLGYLPADIWQFNTGTTNSFVPISQFIDRQYFNG